MGLDISFNNISNEIFFPPSWIILNTGAYTYSTINVRKMKSAVEKGKPL
jgi:hypothetical protein